MSSIVCNSRFKCSSLVSVNSVATEPAVFELACVLNKIKHIVICGHSDCKAVNMLYDIHTDPTDEPPQVSAVSYTSNNFH